MFTFPLTPVERVFLKPQADLIFSVACLRLSDTCNWKGSKIRCAADLFPVIFMTCTVWEHEVWWVVTPHVLPRASWRWLGMSQGAHGCGKKRGPGTLLSFHAVFAIIPLFAFPITRLSTNFWKYHLLSYRQKQSTFELQQQLLQTNTVQQFMPTYT